MKIDGACYVIDTSSLETAVACVEESIKRIQRRDPIQEKELAFTTYTGRILDCFLFPDKSAVEKGCCLHQVPVALGKRKASYNCDWYVAEILGHRPDNIMLLADVKNNDIRKSQIECVSYSLSAMSRPNNDELFLALPCSCH